jgi:hypothetical protein
MRTSSFHVTHPTAPIEGTVAPGFEAVRAEFERNFAERGEIGAAVAASGWSGNAPPFADLGRSIVAG